MWHFVMKGDEEVQKEHFFMSECCTGEEKLFYRKTANN